MTVDEAMRHLEESSLALEKARLDYMCCVQKTRCAAESLAKTLQAEIKKPIIEINDFEVG